jgi:uncharacterized membrane protein
MKGNAMTNGNESNERQKDHWMSYILPIALIAGLVALLIVISDMPSDDLQPIIPEETWLTRVVGYLIIATEIAAAFVIGVGVIRSLISYIRHIFDKMNQQINSTERIRLRLGHILNLGLEFAMASDILRLAVSPTTADFIILFAIVLLRILLNYFLEREIRSSEDFFDASDYLPPESE